MRDKDGWDLSPKQAAQYLDNVKMLYGPPNKGSVGIVPPRVNLEDLGLVHELPQHATPMSPQHAMETTGLIVSKTAELAPSCGIYRSSKKVPRRTSNPKPIKEWREQAAVVKWCKNNPLIAEDVVRIENERKRTMAQAHVAKMMGLHPGATDLFISYPCHGYHGLWLEMKQNRIYTPSDRRKPSWVAQEAFMARKRKQGYAATFAFGADHGIKIIKQYLEHNHTDYDCPPDGVNP